MPLKAGAAAVASSRVDRSSAMVPVVVAGLCFGWSPLPRHVLSAPRPTAAARTPAVALGVPGLIGWLDTTILANTTLERPPTVSKRGALAQYASGLHELSAEEALKLSRAERTRLQTMPPPHSTGYRGVRRKQTHFEARAGGSSLGKFASAEAAALAYARALTAGVRGMEDGMMSVEVVAFDLNSLLHASLRLASSEEHAIKLVFMRLHRVLRHVRPTQSVVIALDGPGPLAKMSTQRRRRLKTESQEQSGKLSRGLSPSLATPGTAFMTLFEDALLHFCSQELTTQRGRGISFYLSGAETPGKSHTSLTQASHKSRVSHKSHARPQFKSHPRPKSTSLTRPKSSHSSHS